MELRHDFARGHHKGGLMNLLVALESLLEIGYRIVVFSIYTWDEIVETCAVKLLEGLAVGLAVNVFDLVPLTGVVLECVHHALHLERAVEAELGAQLCLPRSLPHPPVMVLGLGRLIVDEILLFKCFLHSLFVSPEGPEMHHPGSLHLTVELRVASDVMAHLIWVLDGVDSNLVSKWF